VTFWDTALASGLGALFGALGAFGFNLGIESLKRRQANIVAGNVAMSLLRSKLTYVEIVAKHWRDEHNKKTAGPFWWQYGATTPFPQEMRRVDVSGLGFLGGTYPGLISDVIDADLTYADFMDALASYRDAFTTKMWTAMHGAGSSRGRPYCGASFVLA
jgi:hypothetical protein